MFWKREKGMFHRILTVMIATCMLFSFTSATFAQDSQRTINWQDKIQAELWEVMSKSADDDLIPVWLWLQPVPRDVITRALVEEKKMDPEVYEDPIRFGEEISPGIARLIEERVGYEEAHAKVSIEGMSLQEIDELFTDENGIFFDRSISLVDRAISAKIDEYMMAKREIVRREYSAVNDRFVKDNIGGKAREIFYNSRYSSTLIVEATKAEIEAYAKKDIIVDITLYVELIPETELNIAPGQVGADGTTGTKSSGYNSGAGYKGTGVKIGIIEGSLGYFDSSAPQLSGIPSTRLILANDAGVGGTALSLPSIPSGHTTGVTSIVVGQSVTVGGVTYEGIVPLATVYQTPTSTTSDMLRAFQQLVNKGVSVINYSGGLDTGAGYDSWDRDIDQLIANTGTSFVKSAGNEGLGSGNVTSPGKAFNAITVGNASTKTSNTVADTAPFSVHSSSSFIQASSLPNKPDIVAPGTNTSFVISSGTVNTAIGTSRAAPIVTGIVAQIMQKDSFTKFAPSYAKAVLLLGADYSKMRTSTSSPSDSTNLWVASSLWAKIGTGLVNAPNAINFASARLTPWFSSSSSSMTQSLGYVAAGQKIRLVMPIEKWNTSSSSFDNVDVYIINASGFLVAASTSTVQNVEIIEHAFTSSGDYTIVVQAVNVVNASTGVVASVQYRIY